MNSDDKKNIEKSHDVLCSICGNEVDCEIISIPYKNKEQICEENPELGHIYTTFYLLKCPVCSNLLLNKYSYTIDFDNEEPCNFTNEILYPITNKKFNSVPKEIIKEYITLNSLIYSDTRAALMKMRVIIEMICKNRKAEGKNLNDKLLDLYNKGIISKFILKCCNIIKLLGNDNTHEFYHTNIAYYDLNVIKEFVEMIISYVYELRVKSYEICKKFNLRKIVVKSDKEQSLFNNWLKSYEKFNYDKFEPYWLLEVPDEFVENLFLNTSLRIKVLERIKLYCDKKRKLNSKIVKLYFKYIDNPEHKQ